MGRRSCNEPVPSAAIKAAEGCAIVRIFFRETGMPVHTGTVMQYSLHPLNERREYQRRSSEIVFRKYGFALLMVADIIVRVACWFLEQYSVPKARINLKNRVAIRITYTLKKD
jgi:hypothetical protein